MHNCQRSGAAPMHCVRDMASTARLAGSSRCRGEVPSTVGGDVDPTASDLLQGEQTDSAKSEAPLCGTLAVKLAGQSPRASGAGRKVRAP